MIVPPSEIRTFFEDLDNSGYDLIADIHLDTESFVKQYCNRDFESTSYRLKRFDGNGSQILNLDDYPITAVDRVAIDTLNVIRVKNSNLDSVASISVNTDGIRTVLDGVADTSITFALNTTITAIVDALNAIGNGWSAELASPIYGGFKSNELIPVYGLNCANNNWADLKKTDQPEDKFYVDLGKGQIRNFFGWPKGYQNIYCDYTAGYTSSNMPNDLKFAIKIIVQFFANKRNDDSFGVKEYRAHNIWAAFDKDETIPKEAQRILFRYKRRKL